MSCLPDIEKNDMTSSVATAVRSALQRCNALPLSIAANADIQHEGDRPEFVYLVKSGWLYSYGVLADGQRQILYLHKPGDMAGFVDLGSKRAICSLRSLRDCVVHPIPMSSFTSPSFLTPAIATFFLHKSAEMQSILMRTLMAVGRMGARERIVWLLLMLHDRLNGALAQDAIELPLNQSELGDLIGLTNVSISKNLCQLSTEGFIERKGSMILLRRHADMQRKIGYEPMGLPPDILFQEKRPVVRGAYAKSRATLEPAVSRRVLQADMDKLDGWEGN